MDGFLATIADSALAGAIRDQLMPFVRAGHFAGVGLMVGAILLFDLRVLGVGAPVPAASAHRLAIAPVWAGFAIAVATGLLLFSTQPQDLIENGAFLAKVGLICLAGLNALLFETMWKRAQTISRVLTASAAASLAIWITVILCSAWIPFWRF